jgi:hypothetical protein
VPRTVLHLGQAVQHALLVGRRHGIETVKGIAHGLAKSGGLDRAQSADGVLVQEGITADRHFNLGSYESGKEEEEESLVGTDRNTC